MSEMNFQWSLSLLLFPTTEALKQDESIYIFNEIWILAPTNITPIEDLLNEILRLLQITFKVISIDSLQIDLLSHYSYNQDRQLALFIAEKSTFFENIKDFFDKVDNVNLHLLRKSRVKLMINLKSMAFELVSRLAYWDNAVIENGLLYKYDIYRERFLLTTIADFYLNDYNNPEGTFPKLKLYIFKPEME